MRFHRALPAAAVAALAAAATALAVAAHDPGGPTGNGTVRRTLPDGRPYYMHLPPPSTSAAPRPLIVALHDADRPGPGMETLTGLSDYADAHRLAVAYGATVRWDAGGCCARNPSDDVGYVRAVVRAAATAGPVLIDLSRVYVLGYGNGGMLAWRVACQAPDLVAAAGVVAGALLVDCQQTRVRVYHLHGAADQVVPYTGGPGFERTLFPDSRREDCGDPWTPDCVVGPGSTVHTQLWSGGHEWPASAAATIVPWLLNFSRPTPTGPPPSLTIGRPR